MQFHQEVDFNKADIVALVSMSLQKYKARHFIADHILSIITHEISQALDVIAQSEAIRKTDIIRLYLVQLIKLLPLTSWETLAMKCFMLLHVYKLTIFNS